MKHALVLVFALSIGTAAAQDCVYSWGSDPATGARAYLFSAVPSPSTPPVYYRTQLLIPAVPFGNVPRLISDIAVGVRQGWRWVHIDELSIRIGYTSVTQLNRTFAQNITQPLQTVLDVRDHTFFQGIGPAWVPIGLQEPFLFLPGRGDLLIEIVQLEGREFGLGRWTGLAAGDGSTLSAAGLAIPTNSSGSFGVAPKLRFCVDRPELMELGQACAGSANTTPLLGLSGSAAIGNNTAFWLSNALPSNLAFLGFGFDNSPPLPRDLTAIGMPGCRQYFSVSTATSLLTDGNGVAQHTIPIPGSTVLVGAILFGQFFSLDPGANALGATSSNYGRVLVGI